MFADARNVCRTSLVNHSIQWETRPEPEQIIPEWNTMKSLKTFLVGLSSLVALSACAAEGLVTLAVHGSATNYVTNEVQIASYQQAVIKTYLDQANLYAADCALPCVAPASCACGEGDGAVFYLSTIDSLFHDWRT